MHHHIHIGFGAIFMFVLLVVSLVGFVLWYLADRRKERDRHEERLASIKQPRPTSAYQAPSVQSGATWSRGQPDHGVTARPMTSGYVAPTYSAPAPTPQIIHSGSGNDMLTGMLLGEMIASPRETIVEREYVHQPSPSSDSSYTDSYSSSSSSGIDYSSSDSGSSFDSGSSSDSGSSGIDISW